MANRPSDFDDILKRLSDVLDRLPEGLSRILGGGVSAADLQNDVDRTSSLADKARTAAARSATSHRRGVAAAAAAASSYSTSTFANSKARSQALARVQRLQRTAINLGAKSRGARAAFGNARMAAQGARGQVARRAATVAGIRSGMAGVASVAGALRSVANPLIAFGGIIASLVNSGRQFAEQTNEGNKALGRFNMNIAAAFAGQQFADYRRNMSLARGNENTTVNLARSITDLRDAYLNFDIAKGGVSNRIGLIGSEIAGGIGRGFIDPISKQLSDFMERNDPGGVGVSAFGRSLGANLAGLGAAIFDPLNAPDAFDKAFNKAMEAAKDPAFEQPFTASLFQIAAWGPLNPRRSVPEPK